MTSGEAAAVDDGGIWLRCEGADFRRGFWGLWRGLAGVWWECRWGVCGAGGGGGGVAGIVEAMLPVRPVSFVAGPR